MGNSKFNAGLLQVARLSRGMSQETLAEKAKLTQGYVSKVEAGVIVEPDEAAVSEFARVLDYPASFFYEPDRMIGLPVSVHPMYRKRASVGKRAIDTLQALMNIRLFHLRRLLNSTDHNRKIPLPEMDPDEYGGAERIAELVRRTWLVPNGPIQNLTAFIERAGCVVVSCELPDESVDGVTLRVVDLPPVIFLNSSLPADRQRFTLAHELGHLIMHRTPSVDMESEANLFASALLLDRAGILERVRGTRVTLALLAQLKPAWRVSMQAILYRLEKLGAVTSSQAGYLWRQMSTLGYRTHEPDELSFPAEQTSVMPRLIEMHLKDFNYTTEQLSKALHSLEPEMVAMYGLESKKSPRLRVVK
jgi:Zn-dependent peptidase ImmA (M78 family)/transcriptional regulator with XRE-family HTH domain